MIEAKISEIFKSYQGEGIWQGKEQVFVRFFGCNLSCSFCDTILSSYQKIDIDGVCKRIMLLAPFHSLSLTGGEPLLQVNFLHCLLRRLKQKKISVYLETNGMLHDNLSKIIGYIDLIAMDFKFPTSSGNGPFWPQHQKFITAAAATDIFAKAVIGPETKIEDLDKAIEIIHKANPRLLLVLQPQNPYENQLRQKLAEFKKRCTNRSISAKIIPQLHKQVGIK